MRAAADGASDVGWAIARDIPHYRRCARSPLRGDREAADDLVQDGLEHGLRTRQLWCRTGCLRSWLFRIVFTQILSGGSSARNPSANRGAATDRAGELLACDPVVVAVERLKAGVVVEMPGWRIGRFDLEIGRAGAHGTGPGE